MLTVSIEVIFIENINNSVVSSINVSTIYLPVKLVTVGGQHILSIDSMGNKC